MHLSNREARRLFLNQQGLLRRNQFGRGKNAVLKSIQRKGYVQIDTISVINRAHEHVLSSRVENFAPRMLDTLTKNRDIYEYWGHAAAFLPFENYRFSLPVMRGWADSRTWNKQLAEHITSRIRAEGPLQSRDFEDSRQNKTTGWWDWKPAKQVLEHLFLSGELMVTRREGFQKVFDLPENVIPDHVDTSLPTNEEWAHFIVDSMAEALGVATEYDLSYSLGTVRRLAKVNLRPAVKQAIADKVASGELVQVDVEGKPYLLKAGLEDTLPLRLAKKEVRILSPFDNLVINRKRTSALFDFDYLLECYLPEEKRVYGYFTLPILYGDELIGRLDAKAERKQQHLVVKNLVLEPSQLEPSGKAAPELIDALAIGIRDLGTCNNCESWKVTRSTPAALKAPLNKALANL